jgi:hypothetical protein
MLSFFTKLVPWYYRVAAIAVMAGGLWLHGYYKGWEHEHEKLDEVTAKIQQERDQQALQAAQRTIKDKENLSNVVQTFHSNIAAISDYWLRQRPKAASGVPAKAEAPTGVAGTCTDSVPAGQYQELEKACSVTTEMFNACRDGWVSQEDG